MESVLEPRKIGRLSFVFPVYNEEEGLPFLRRELEAWMKEQSGRMMLEIVLVNDGSTDASLPFCMDWARANRCLRLVSFSRNFGHQAAVSAGLRYATGDAVVIMDADLQDPLRVVPEMIRRYEEGYDVVYGQRRERKGETAFKKASAWLFYRLLRHCVHKSIPADTGDFRLVSRRCVDIVNAMPEKQRFLRGMFAWIGFPQIAVPYVRDERRFGTTKYPLHKMLRFAWTGITSFSSYPIRLVSVLGLCFSLIGFAGCLYALICYAAGSAVQGWTSLLCLQALLSGVVLLSIGITGEYVGKIFEELKCRPLYLVEKTFNVEEEELKR